MAHSRGEADMSRTKLPPPDPLASEVHVSPDGDDGGDGSVARPFAGLSRARDEVRAFRSRGVDGPIAVTVAAGEYEITATLELTEADSGTAEGLVV